MKTKNTKAKQELVLEVDTNLQRSKDTFVAGKMLVMVTPDINEDYWMFRVKLSSKQAIVGFPKFSSIGIGFSKEIDWNTNLPSNCEAEYIFNHIKVNKGSKLIKDEDCIRAIEMIQEAVKKYKKQ